MDKLQAYNALQELARYMAQGSRDGFNEGDQENYLAQARQIAQQAGLDPNQIENWLGQAASGISTTDVPGLGTPEAIARANFARGESGDTLGLTLEQMAKDTGSTLQDGFLSPATIPKDYMLGDNSSMLENVIKFASLAAAGYGLGTGLEGLISGSGLGAGAGAVSDPFIQAYTPDLASSGLFSGAGAGAGLSPTNVLQAVDGVTQAPTGDILSQYGGTTGAPVDPFSPITQQGAGQQFLTNEQLINNVAGGSTSVPGLLSNAGTAAAVAGGAGVIPGITNAAGQIAGLDGVVNLANSAGGAVTPAATGSTSWLSQFLKSLGVTNEAGTTTSSPLLQGAGALLSYFQGQNRLGTLNDTLKSAADKADPFASQRGFYQDKLKQSYMDPNFFQNDPVFSGIRKTAMNDVERAAAARGYNNSSNVLHNVGSRINDEGLKYANLYQGQLAQNAGAGVSPAAGAGIQAQGAQLASGIQNSSNANIGSFLAQLPGIAKQFGLT